MVEKPQLHQSMLRTLSRCGEQFRRRYICGDKEAPGIALVIGKSTHKVVEKNLRNKIKTKGQLLSLEEIKDSAHDEFINSWNETPIILLPEERELGIKKVKGQSLDMTVKLCELHHANIAPDINPIENGIERKFVVICKGYNFDIAGTIDIQEEERIRDTKTSNRRLTQQDVDSSLQLTIYALAAKIFEGQIPKETCFDILIKKSVPESLTLTSKRNEKDFIAFKNRFEKACEVIEKGMFYPTDYSNYWCSKLYCGYYDTCPYVSGRKSFSLSVPKRQINKPVKIISANSKEWQGAIL